jgi:subtilisin family serine protease
MIRPRDAFARLAASPDATGPLRAGSGIQPTIALIDGIPDLRTQELEGACVELRHVAVVDANSHDPHSTFGACILVGQHHGLVPHARLIAFGVTATDATIAAKHIARAVEQACNAGAQIIAIPLGDHQEHAEVAEAIGRALASGAVIVAAAGNAHPHPLLFPARLPGVLAVGACDDTGALLEDCCRVPAPDWIVPAREILAADAPGREVARSGTSVATVVAAGLLALEFSLHQSTPEHRETA